jgi:histidine triad (HIT) family protein
MARGLRRLVTETCHDAIMAETEGCLFCAIAAGEIPAEVVAETDRALAFRDLSPQAPLHVLVIPRSHAANAAELASRDPQTLAGLFELARDVAEQAGHPSFRTVFNTGEAAGQTVFHAHLHVLAGRSMTWPPG